MKVDGMPWSADEEVDDPEEIATPDTGKSRLHII